ncbi:MAG: AAA family ATPase [Ardenticatenaceae bacterium]|nr:AAA family ATPase [Ardenticatenaceae bacterium]
MIESVSLERTQLEEAIAVLQRQSSLLDAGIVQLILTVLQEKLDSLRQTAVSQTTQRKQVTTLFANVSGFTWVFEAMSDTNVLNMMNLLWNQLDMAIKEQGGMVDKHLGDGVMGVFGVPVAYEDDPIRAIRAALDMRALLSDFLQDLANSPIAAAAVGETEANWHDRLRGLQIRVGVNTGPVLLGQVGASHEFTAIGDAVNVGRRLEQAAPPGGILISHETYVQVRGTFDVEPIGPIAVKGRTDPVTAYLVLGVRPRLFQATGRGVEGVETQMVGRDEELQQLQETVRRAVQLRQGQWVTVTGEAGVGKSRLVHEFTRWLRESGPQDVVVLKGRAEPEERPLPFTLIRDLFTTYFDIRDNDRAVVAEEKFVRGMQQFVSQPEADIRQRVRVISQLIGLGGADVYRPVRYEVEPLQLRDRAYRYVTGLFAAITAVSHAAVLILEDVHWADTESLKLIAHLSRICRREPLLIISLARPLLFEREPDWLTMQELHRHVQIRPLAEDESYQLVQNILRKLPEIPDDLTNLIVERAEGNPFYVEEMVKILIEDGLIIPGQTAWRLQPKRLTRVRVPPTLTGVLQARLDRLSTLERITLQKAAVVGREFWDRVVGQMQDDIGRTLDEGETLIALQALEKREMVFRRQTSGFAGAQAYIFKHAMLRDVAYESVLLRQRPLYHKQAADWLVTESGDRVAEYASAIAEHYEEAAENITAAQFYEMAAEQAQERDNPELAIDYYRKVLALLSEYPDLVVELLRVQEKLGDLLKLQARLVEASQIYMLMRHTAELDGDLEAQARACNGLAEISQQQANYASMLGHVVQSEQIAWLVNAELELARGLLLKGAAHLGLGDVESAQQTAVQAIGISERVGEARFLTESLSLLCVVQMQMGQAVADASCLQRLDAQAADLRRHEHLREALAFNQIVLGGLYNELGQYNRAARYLLEALRLYREIGHQVAVANTLNTLGETARLQGNAQAALTLHRQALQIAEAIGDRYGELFYRTNLGGAYVQARQFAEAVTELRQVIALSQDVARVVTWMGLAEVYDFLAAAYLGLGELAEAKTAVLQAQRQAQKSRDTRSLAIAWRILGKILSQVGEPISLAEKTWTASACFAKSLRVLQENGRAAMPREQAYTLWDWAIHEQRQGLLEKSQQLQKRALLIAKKLKISFPQT